MNLTCTAPIEENDLRLLLIIRRVTVKWETPKAGIFRIKTWKWHQNSVKICSGTIHSSDLSLGIHCICSQSRDTIPLSKALACLHVYLQYICSCHPAARSPIPAQVGSSVFYCPSVVIVILRIKQKIFSTSWSHFVVATVQYLYTVTVYLATLFFIHYSITLK